MDDTERDYNFVIYTDGGYNPATKIGTWGYIIRGFYKNLHLFGTDGKPLKYTEIFHEDSGGARSDKTSPITMELFAMLKAIKTIETRLTSCEPTIFTVSQVVVSTDSKQLTNCYELIKKYEENDWHGGSGIKVLPHIKGLWNAISFYNEKYAIQYRKVKSHVQKIDEFGVYNDNFSIHHKFNNMVDEMCKKAEAEILKTI